MGEPTFEIDRDNQPDTQLEEVVHSNIESPEVVRIPGEDVDKFYDKQKEKDEERKKKGPTYH